MTKNNDILCLCLDTIPIFANLNDNQKNLIHKSVKHLKFKAGETIYLPGQKANALYIINEGKIRIYRLAENGKEQLLRIIIPGEFTGELALFKAGIYEAFAEALEDCYICSIDHDNFKDMLLIYPDLATKMLEVLANRLSVSEEQTAWISTETVKERLMHYLVRTSYKKLDKFYIDLTMPKKALASYLGTTPESLSREWTKLEQNGTLTEINKKTFELKGFL